MSITHSATIKVRYFRVKKNTLTQAKRPIQSLWMNAWPVEPESILGRVTA